MASPKCFYPDQSFHQEHFCNTLGLENVFFYKKTICDKTQNEIIASGRMAFSGL